MVPIEQLEILSDLLSRKFNSGELKWILLLKKMMDQSLMSFPKF
jgi:hypothetical protein